MHTYASTYTQISGFWFSGLGFFGIFSDLGGGMRGSQASKCRSRDPRASKRPFPPPGPPKSCLRATREPPKAPQERRRPSQERPRAAHERPRAFQKRARGAQERPGAAQEWLKSGWECEESVFFRSFSTGFVTTHLFGKDRALRPLLASQEHPTSGQEHTKSAQERLQSVPRAAKSAL